MNKKALIVFLAICPFGLILASAVAMASQYRVSVFVMFPALIGLCVLSVLGISRIGRKNGP